MEPKSIFSNKTLTDFLQNNFQLDPKQNFKYLVKQCGPNEDILCVKASSENGDFEIKLITVKMPNNKDFYKKKVEYARSLENVFTIQDDNKNGYFVLADKDILFPLKNNLENLNTILRSLAELQANYLAQPRSETIRNSEYNVKNVSDAVILLKFFEAFDKDDLNDTISKIQKSIDDLFGDRLLVKSVGSILPNSVFLTASGKCVFLGLDHEVFRSPVYDALIFIFALSDETFRQHHLKTLLSLYYQTFIDLVKKSDESVKVNFDINVFESHVKILLPIVKFETAVYLTQNEQTIQEKNHLEQLLNNILYSLKYQQIIYEDCLEAISRKLGSTKFELEKYQLVPLGEKNGHLGEYFSLKSKINYAGKSEEFSMFLKILNASNPVLNSYIQPASKKEQFFFRTMISLFKQHGLESLIDFAPNCYFDRLNDVIIQDDLTQLGYKPNRPNAKIGYDILKAAFIEAAKLHACTLLLEDRLSRSQGTPVRLNDIYEEFFKDWVFDTTEGLPKLPVHPVYFKPGLDQLIDSLLDKTKYSIGEFHKKVDGLFEVFIERLNSPSKQFRNVICHGDLYAGNMLTKYDHDGLADKCFLIDFQALRYAPITEDILLLAYCNTDKNVRDKFLNKLLEEYYDELKKIMLEFDEDINKFYTYEEFTKCVEYMKPIAIMAAIAYAQVTLVPQDKREEIYFDEKKFNYYLLENRKEYIKYLLTFPEDYVLYLKGLIDDLYGVCVNY